MSAGFRKFRAGGRGAGRLDATASSFAASPFTQAQILHLMKAEFARARRYGFPLSCILLQVDRLPSLVDLHGLELRETVQRELGELVRRKTRDADHLGLLSEDRYLLLLPHTPEKAAVAVAERIRRSFSEVEIEAHGNLLALTLSAGVAACEDQETLFFDTLLSQAELALEQAAEAGGDQVVVFRKAGAAENE